MAEWWEKATLNRIAAMADADPGARRMAGLVVRSLEFDDIPCPQVYSVGTAVVLRWAVRASGAELVFTSGECYRVYAWRGRAALDGVFRRGEVGWGDIDLFRRAVAAGTGHVAFDVRDMLGACDVRPAS